MSSRSPGEQRTHLELVTIYEICRLLGASLDISRTFRAALNVLTAHLDLPKAMIVTAAEDGTALQVHSSVGLTREQAQRGRWAVGEGVVGRVYATGMPVVVPDIANVEEFVDRTGAFSAPGDGRMLAFIVVPLKNDGAVTGVLAAQREVQGGARLTEDQRLLTMVATLLSQAMMLHETVREEHRRLQQESMRLQKALQRPQQRTRFALDNVVGDSVPMQQVFLEVQQAAPSRATVLLRGESGTGKEAIARAIHFLSPRKDAPFIKVNCAALTESLLESELFGHEKGAFTGAAGERKGRFELAHGGTLFLDEIGDISPAFQAKLLRVLQEREFERVGGSRAVKVDVRLICATNRDLEKMVQRGEYRADLYYRINVVSIFLPPLRERRADIPALVTHFLERFNKENRRKLRMTQEAMEVLASCYWPGNVRELENCVERTATMVQGDVIRDLAFPCRQNRCLTQTLHFVEKADAVSPVIPRLNPAPPPQQPHSPIVPPSPASNSWSEAPQESDVHVAVGERSDGVTTIGPTVHVRAPSERNGASGASGGGAAPQGERERLIWAMEQCGWVQAKAARLLRVTPRQLGYALLKHRIEVRKF
ncbi:nif-specific transcriptional activator NifA [Azohydromonas lata]|uniref:Nif-specific regulatory protein n=1 Tax=Azohydromonas lata TaxID=45677 RepID=A0ABU5IGW4_9BURK|nr:nif-specific transcriptional activator NifA [Azohydromonas lata]MDZ5458386.1 nif-specific transcriptional activator NifA [Azohydromonas lata]